MNPYEVWVRCFCRASQHVLIMDVLGQKMCTDLPDNCWSLWLLLLIGQISGLTGQRSPRRPGRFIPACGSQTCIQPGAGVSHSGTQASPGGVQWTEVLHLSSKGEPTFLLKISFRETVVFLLKSWNRAKLGEALSKLRLSLGLTKPVAQC